MFVPIHEALHSLAVEVSNLQKFSPSKIFHYTVYGGTNKFGDKQKLPYMAIHYMYPKWYSTVYIWPQIVDIGTLLFCFVYPFTNFPALVVYSCLLIAGS